MGFDSIAKYYDWLARLVFGSSILNSQTLFLNKIPPSSKVLVLGGGTGWWLKELLFNRPGCRILFIERSAEMMKLAMKANEDDRIIFVLGTENSLNSWNEFDVIITFFYLDLFQEKKLQGVIEKIRLSMKPNALWLAADFVKTKWWHSVMLFMMYAFFWFTTGLRNRYLPNWEAFLLENDLTKVDGEMFYGNFMMSGLYRVKN